jgi:hypothetical protein
MSKRKTERCLLTAGSGGYAGKRVGRQVDGRRRRCINNNTRQQGQQQQ